ncbi:MAG TPA: hypothetical protein VE994_05205 [Terriglobales bacterium]|nr:hypothetical protein [Terriglobales bacterium]
MNEIGEFTHAQNASSSSRIIRDFIPDKNGKTLPADLASGSYEVRDLTNHAFGTLFEAKVIYDITYGHVTYGCNQCCGYTTPVTLWYNPVLVPFTSTADDGVFAYEPCMAGYDDVSSYFYSHWNSNDTSVVTVDAIGTHYGVAVGSTTSFVSAAPLPNNNIRLNCPNSMMGPSQGGANVNPTVSFSEIPYVVIGQTATTTVTVNPTDNAIPISLSVSSSASIVSPTGTFTQNTSAVVKGQTVGTATLNATVQNADGSKPIVGSTSFPVTSAAPTATISQKISGPYSSDDGAGANYTAQTGTSSLGPFATTKFKGCGVGYETVGNINPSNYTGNVIIHRTIATDQAWINSTEDPTGEMPPGSDDTSLATFQDSNPQSGGSAG